MKSRSRMAYILLSEGAAQVKASLRSLLSLSSVGWKSFKGNMNRVVSGESASETRKAGRAQSFGASEGASLNLASSHERAQVSNARASRERLGKEERRLIMVESEGAKYAMCICLCYEVLPNKSCLCHTAQYFPTAGIVLA